MEKVRPLKLRARDLEDMTVMAAVLQDAVVRPAEMTFLARENRFVMVLSRFRWEEPVREAGGGAETQVEPPGSPDSASAAAAAAVVRRGEEGDARFEDAGPRPLYERVNAGLCFEKVRRVRTQKLDLKDKDRVLSLLTVEARPGALTLVFSGGALVRLEVGAIACFLEDLGEPWPTPWLPLHESDDERADRAGEGASGTSGTSGPGE